MRRRSETQFWGHNPNPILGTPTQFWTQFWGHNPYFALARSASAVLRQDHHPPPAQADHPCGPAPLHRENRVRPRHAATASGRRRASRRQRWGEGQHHRHSRRQRRGVRPGDGGGVPGRRGDCRVRRGVADDGQGRGRAALHPGRAGLWGEGDRADPGQCRSGVSGGAGGYSGFVKRSIPASSPLRRQGPR